LRCGGLELLSEQFDHVGVPCSFAARVVGALPPATAWRSIWVVLMQRGMRLLELPDLVLAPAALS